MRVKLPFRPSSHSTDHTVLAVFETPVQAKSASRRMWAEIKRKGKKDGPFESSENLHFESEGKNVFYHGYDSFETFGFVLKLFVGKTGLKKVYLLKKEYAQISVAVPASKNTRSASRLNPALLALFLPPEEIKAIKQLRKICNTSFVNSANETKVVFTYFGYGILEKPPILAHHTMPPKYPLSLGASPFFCEVNRCWKNWHISRVPPKVFRELRPTVQYNRKKDGNYTWPFTPIRGV
jgi:hypothetical protein